MTTRGDRFFDAIRCDRCGQSLEKGRIMSMYNEDVICMACKEKEMKRADYSRAVEQDVDQIRKGNYNFKGMGYASIH